MSEPTARYAVTPEDASPARADSPSSPWPTPRSGPLRCFDAACPVREACPLWQGRHGPSYGPVANTWRIGYEYPGEPCARGRAALASRQPGEPSMIRPAAPITQEDAPC